MHEDLKYWIALSSIEGLSALTLKTIYEKFNDIIQVWNADEISLFGINLKRRQLEIFLEEKKKINPDKIFEEILKRKLNVITYADENYPSILKEIYDPPFVLYYKGDLKRLNFKRTLAVVGSRRASTGAMDSLTKIIKEMQNTDICIVSGLAEGIDTVAHACALRYKLPTIAVIGSGLDFKYPSSNRPLYEKIEDEGGVIFSEYYPTFAPLPMRFPQRNRIVTGLSYGTLVAEAAIRSGALISANLTLEQGRELMCLPGLVTNPNTEGIYKLLQNGATLVTSAGDVFNALNWELVKPEKEEINLDDDEKKVYNVLKTEPLGIDALSIKSGLNISDLMVTLTTLELKGLVAQGEGESYKVIG